MGWASASVGLKCKATQMLWSRQAWMAQNYPDYLLQPGANWPGPTCPPTYLSLSVSRFFCFAIGLRAISQKKGWIEQFRWQLTCQRPRKKASSGQTPGGCGRQRGKWPLCCGTSGCRKNARSRGCRSCSGPKNHPYQHLCQLCARISVVKNVHPGRGKWE